ncbi:importin-alpha [Theileria orientalis strain Shintoku]|uniref:Importin-alpha n=1 Tax=Theileria orientalis strain Shintoku TaxID=869250 RepID=J4DAI3_THEOR|nr:importin-alpha [Theileria orientalis strain Shintoku]BAM42005.1 importin-alpha [Theileria orientalis strain Shintoku]|eukprot:XP_009692306.1 importin-alpha [Theileria orientalis strain Shintoku]
MSDISFIRSIISLCRQSLSGNKIAIKSAEDQMSMLVKSDTSETEIKIALIFKIILSPQAISAPENTLSDDELCGLKLASSDVQLWAAIFLKNYTKSNFDTSESFGGATDSTRRIIKSFLIICTLNKDKLGISTPIASQLESTLLMIGDRDFPESMEHVLMLISYCHMSDINPLVLVETLTTRLQTQLRNRGVNVLNTNVNTNSSLNRAVSESQSNYDLKYAEYLINHVKNYVNLSRSIASYNNILNTNNIMEISRCYFEFFNALVDGVKNMCSLRNSVTLKDLEMNKFVQSVSFLFSQSTLNTHTANPASQSYEVDCNPSDSLFYFDDRNLFNEPKLFQYGQSVPELGGNQHNVQLLLSPSMFVNESSLNKAYFKTKLSSFKLFTNLMKKYKARAYDNDTLCELKIILTLSDVHLLYVYKYFIYKFTQFYNFYKSMKGTFTSNFIVPVMLDQLEFIRQVIKIFVYVHTIDLPESFEDNAQLYFSGIINLLQFNDQQLVQNDTTGTILKMKVAFLRLLKFYAERYQEVFHPFVFTCIEDVVKLCRTTTQDASEDKLCCAALDFLSAASTTHWGSSPTASARSNPYMNNAFLAEIIQTIIVPNIGFRECDLLLLDDCPIEFVQRELDTNSCSSRRFSSISFLKKLVSSIGQVCQQIIAQVATNVASSNDYKLKELYLQLIICINFKESSGEFNINNYFNKYLKNEFVLLAQTQLTQEKRLIILAIMKYIITFQNLFSEIDLVALVPYLVLYLNNSHEALRSFSAEALSRVLAKVRLHKPKLKTCILQALDNLLTLMKNGGRSGNEFYSKCTMKIFLYLREDVRESGMLMIQIVISLIKMVTDNPVNPAYNHYLFESLSILLRLNLQTESYGLGQPLEKIEESLIPMLAMIIQQEMHPFIPYSLQVLCIMLKFANKASTTYLQLLNHLLTIETWKVSIANAQGNIKLLVCFFEKHSIFESEINKNMEKILNIFHFCLVHRKLSTHSLDMINGIIRFLPLSYYVAFIKSIVTVLLTYIHNNKGSDALVDVVTTMSLLTAYLHLHKYEMSLIEILETIQVGITSSFMEMVYVPNVKKTMNTEAKRVHAVAIAKMATLSSVQMNNELFMLLMGALEDLISGENVKLDTPKDMLDPNNMEEIDKVELNFDVSYVRLQAANDGRKLLDKNINAEEVIKDLLAPMAGLMKRNLSMSGKFTSVLSLVRRTKGAGDTPSKDKKRARVKELRTRKKPIRQSNKREIKTISRCT